MLRSKKHLLALILVGFCYSSLFAQNTISEDLINNYIATVYSSVSQVAPHNKSIGKSLCIRNIEAASGTKNKKMPAVLLMWLPITSFFATFERSTVDENTGMFYEKALKSDFDKAALFTNVSLKDNDADLYLDAIFLSKHKGRYHFIGLGVLGSSGILPMLLPNEAVKLSTEVTFTLSTKDGRKVFEKTYRHKERAPRGMLLNTINKSERSSFTLCFPVVVSQFIKDISTELTSG